MTSGVIAGRDRAAAERAAQASASTSAGSLPPSAPAPVGERARLGDLRGWNP